LRSSFSIGNAILKGVFLPVLEITIKTLLCFIPRYTNPPLSLLYIGSLLYLLDKNEEKATSSALLESAISVAAIIGPMAGGMIAEISGFFETPCSLSSS
jgi:hypothetical protein